MKLRSAIILTAIPMALLLQGCASDRDISSQSPYSELVGKKFVLLRDCYIVRTMSDHSQIGVDSATRGGYAYMPKEVSPQFIHRRVDQDVEIAGILPKGSVFTIVGCEERRSPENDFKMFKATFEVQNPEFQGLVFNIAELTNMAKGTPTFLNDLAKPVE